MGTYFEVGKNTGTEFELGINMRMVLELARKIQEQKG